MYVETCVYQDWVVFLLWGFEKFVRYYIHSGALGIWGTQFNGVTMLEYGFWSERLEIGVEQMSTFFIGGIDRQSNTGILYHSLIDRIRLDIKNK